MRSAGHNNLAVTKNVVAHTISLLRFAHNDAGRRSLDLLLHHRLVQRLVERLPNRFDGFDLFFRQLVHDLPVHQFESLLQRIVYRAGLFFLLRFHLSGGFQRTSEIVQYVQKPPDNEALPKTGQDDFFFLGPTTVVPEFGFLAQKPIFRRFKALLQLFDGGGKCFEGVFLIRRYFFNRCFSGPAGYFLFGRQIAVSGRFLQSMFVVLVQGVLRLLFFKASLFMHEAYKNAKGGRMFAKLLFAMGRGGGNQQVTNSG